MYYIYYTYWVLHVYHISSLFPLSYTIVSEYRPRQRKRKRDREIEKTKTFSKKNIDLPHRTPICMPILDTSACQSKQRDASMEVTR